VLTIAVTTKLESIAVVIQDGEELGRLFGHLTTV